MPNQSVLCLVTVVAHFAGANLQQASQKTRSDVVTRHVQRRKRVDKNRKLFFYSH